MVVCVGMKLQTELIHQQVDGNRVVEGDAHASLVHGDQDLFLFLDREVELLRLVEDVLPDIVFTLPGIAGQGKTRLALDGVLELVVREVRRNYLHSDEDRRPQEQQRHDEVQACCPSHPVSHWPPRENNALRPVWLLSPGSSRPCSVGAQHAVPASISNLSRSTQVDAKTVAWRKAHEKTPSKPLFAMSKRGRGR